MIRQLFSILMALICCMSIQAKEPTKGYRGFVDLNMQYGSFDNSVSTDHYLLYGLSTSHGYQFNEHFFLGAGVEIQAGAIDAQHRLELPLFLQGRTDWTFGKVPLYLDLRVGGTFFARNMYDGDNKLLIAPTVGYCLDLGKNVGANFGIGLSLHGCDDGFGENHFTWHPMPSLRIGIEF